MQTTNALNDKIKEAEESISAHQEMCNFVKMYSLKLHGVKSDYSTEYEQEKRRMNRPTGRLHSELEDVQRNIGRIKDGLTDLRAQRDAQGEENKRKGLDIQQGIDATKRKHEAHSRLKNHLSGMKQGLDREIAEIKAAIEENEAEAVNMTAFHTNMVRDAEELGKTQEDDKIKIVELEDKERSLTEDNDKALAALREKLHVVEANLGAWAEMEALRAQHEEGMSSLRNQSADNKIASALVDEELDRSRVSRLVTSSVLD